MYLEPVSFDGFALNNSNYQAIIPEDAPASWSVGVLENKRSNAFPHFASLDPNGVTLPMVIKIKGSGSLLAIKKLFNPLTPYQPQPKKLIVRDTNNVQWSCYAVAQNLVQTNARKAKALLRVSEPVWTCESLVTLSAWNVPGANRTVTIGANRTWCNPVLKLKPTGANSGSWAHNEPITVLNKTDKRGALGLKIISGWNTATLVSGGQLQSGCQDVRVTVGGQEIDAWVTGANTADTGVWINSMLEPKIELKLGASIASSGAVAEVTFAKGSEAILKTLRTNGAFKIDNEIFTYTGAVNATTRKIGGCVRAQRNTAMGAHSVNATVYFIEHDYRLLWGNASAAARVNDETKKPAFDMAASTNEALVYTEFGDGMMMGSWTPSTKSNGGVSGHYTDDGNALDGVSPAKVLGFEALAYTNSKGKTVGDTVTIRWGIHHPFGISAVSGTGRKQRVGSAFPKFRLEKSTDGSKWKEVWTEGSPVNPATWTAFTMAEQSLGASASYVPRWAQFEQEGSVSAVAGGLAMVEMQAVTVKPIAANVPTITRQADTTNGAGIDCVITNTTTGDSISLAYAAAQGKTLTVDTENKTITYEGLPADGALVEYPANRGEWLPLFEGANVLSYTGAGTGTVEILIEYRERMEW